MDKSAVSVLTSFVTCFHAQLSPLFFFFFFFNSLYLYYPHLKQKRFSPFFLLLGPKEMELRALLFCLFFCWLASYPLSGELACGPEVFFFLKISRYILTPLRESEGKQRELAFFCCCTFLCFFHLSLIDTWHTGCHGVETILLLFLSRRDLALCVHLLCGSIVDCFFQFSESACFSCCYSASYSLFVVVVVVVVAEGTKTEYVRAMRTDVRE